MTTVHPPTPHPFGRRRNHVEDHEKRVETEIDQLLRDIRRIGPTHPDPEPHVLFGELFNDEQVEQYYEALVGTLKSAKKRGKITFKGQMLLKGMHDNVIISIVGDQAPPQQIVMPNSEKISGKEKVERSGGQSTKPLSQAPKEVASTSSTTKSKKGSSISKVGAKLGSFRGNGRNSSSAVKKHSANETAEENDDDCSVKSHTTAPTYVSHSRGGWKQRQQKKSYRLSTPSSSSSLRSNTIVESKSIVDVDPIISQISVPQINVPSHRISSRFGWKKKQPSTKSKDPIIISLPLSTTPETESSEQTIPTIDKDPTLSSSKSSKPTSSTASPNQSNTNTPTKPTNSRHSYGGRHNHPPSYRDRTDLRRSVAGSTIKPIDETKRTTESPTIPAPPPPAIKPKINKPVRRHPSVEQSQRVDLEIAQLLVDIRRIEPTGEPYVCFGELFDDDDVQQFYEALVGTLKSAKRRGYIEFKGQMLLKGMHDHVKISIKQDGMD